MYQESWKEKNCISVLQWVDCQHLHKRQVKNQRIFLQYVCGILFILSIIYAVVMFKMEKKQHGLKILMRLNGLDLFAIALP